MLVKAKRCSIYGIAELYQKIKSREILEIDSVQPFLTKSFVCIVFTFRIHLGRLS